MGNSYVGGHLMNGMPSAFHHEHQYQQGSPISGTGPFTMNYPYGAGISAMHTRNASMSSSNPSGPGDMSYDGASLAMSMSSIGQEQTGARTILQNAPVQLMRMPEEPREEEAADRIRSQSDPGAFMTSSAPAPPASSATTVTPIVTTTEVESAEPLLRKGSLVRYTLTVLSVTEFKPPAKQTSSRHSFTQWLFGEPTVTLGYGHSIANHVGHSADNRYCRGRQRL